MMVRMKWMVTNLNTWRVSWVEWEFYGCVFNCIFIICAERASWNRKTRDPLISLNTKFEKIVKKFLNNPKYIDFHNAVDITRWVDYLTKVQVSVRW